MTIDPQILVRLLEEDGVKLQGSGTELNARCPLHDDRTASMSVNTEKGFYNCHGCGASGDAWTYLMAGRDMSERDAKAYLQRGLKIVGGTEARKPEKAPYVFKKLPSKNAAGSPCIATHTYNDKDGNRVFVIRRYAKLPEDATDDARKKWRKCDMWSPVDGGWVAKRTATGKKPLYRLPELLGAEKTQQVMIVEGEKCADAVAAAFGKAVVTTWSGGKSNEEQTDWKPIHGRPVLLVSDADEGGRECMERLGAKLHAHCPKVRIVLSPGDDKTDIADWIEKGGGSEARAKIVELVKDAAPPAPDEPPGKPVEISADDDILAKNHYYHVLGNMGAEVAIMLHTNSMLKYSRTSLCQPSTLLSIAPNLYWWLDITGQDKLGPAVCQQVGASILSHADKIGPIDPRKVIGRGCFKTASGDVAWHLGNRLRMNGKEMGLGDIEGVTPIAGPSISVDSECASEEEIREVARAVMSYRWMTPEDGKRYMGWIVSAIIGGGLDWRPHLWINAPSETGKSWIVENVAMPICGDFSVVLKDPTSAGLAWDVQSDSLPVLFDEAEPDRSAVDKILDMARMSSGGAGDRVRADMKSGGVSRIKLRFSLLLSSVNASNMRQADANRFTMIHLSGDGVSDWPAVKRAIQGSLKRPGRILAAIVRDGADLIGRVREAEDRLISVGGVSSRRASIEAALTAGWWWWSGKAEMLGDVSQGADETTPDSHELLSDIMGLRLRTQKGVDVSISFMLSDGDDDRIALDYGLKIHTEWKDNIAELWIHPRHPSLLAKLERTRWRNVNIKETLLQIGGVHETPNPVYFGSRRTRAVCIPRAVCEELGINLFENKLTGDADA